eukprot:TRINITY_DN8575_c0_g1_i5.p1 TRINITY_DN8575_c0_g1~~TRINITY_DN8575_c0_g1_i5.p1  ORF type:complete len:365 (+),score=74.71 TRINITY_DN8575_c0_g1_i5:480-1574(+)
MPTYSMSSSSTTTAWAASHPATMSGPMGGYGGGGPYGYGSASTSTGMSSTALSSLAIAAERESASSSSSSSSSFSPSSSSSSSSSPAMSSPTIGSTNRYFGLQEDIYPFVQAHWNALGMNRKQQLITQGSKATHVHHQQQQQVSSPAMGGVSVDSTSMPVVAGHGASVGGPLTTTAAAPSSSSSVGGLLQMGAPGALSSTVAGPALTMSGGSVPVIGSPTLGSGTMLWQKQLLDGLSHNRGVFRSGHNELGKSGYWCLDNPEDPWALDFGKNRPKMFKFHEVKPSARDSSMTSTTVLSVPSQGGGRSSRRGSSSPPRGTPSRRGSRGYPFESTGLYGSDQAGPVSSTAASSTTSTTTRTTTLPD